MKGINDAVILKKCKERLIELGFGGMGLNVLSLQDAAKQYPDAINPYIGKAKWLHLTGANLIVVDTGRVNIDDQDFDRSLCHEAYHEEYIAKADFRPTDLLEQHALKFLSEAYVEKRIASKLPDGEMKEWRYIATQLEKYGLAYVIDFNYQGRSKEPKPTSKEDWWSVINLILFPPLNQASFYFQKTTVMPKQFHIQKIFPGDSFSVKLQEFYLWLEKNAITIPAEQLLSAEHIKAIHRELEKLDSAIPYTA